MKKTDKEIIEEINTRLTVSVPTAGQAVGVGRNASYDAAKRGDLPTVRIGNSIRVPTAWLRQRLGLEKHTAA